MGPSPAQRNPRLLSPESGAVCILGGDPVSLAVIRAAEPAATSLDLLGAARRTLRIPRRRLREIVGRVPVLHPLPHVAGHVVQPVPVGREALDRRVAAVPVQHAILVGKHALPQVRLVLAARGQLVAPGVFRPVQPSAGGEFEFRLGRQARPAPVAVRGSVLPGEVHDRKPGHLLVGGSRSVRVAPVRAIALGPAVLLRIEDPGPAEALGLGNVARGVRELRVLGVRHFVLVDVEGIQHDAVGGALKRKALVRAHHELAPGDEGHPGGVGWGLRSSTRFQRGAGPAADCERGHSGHCR